MTGASDDGLIAYRYDLLGAVPDNSVLPPSDQGVTGSRVALGIYHFLYFKPHE
jgi:hypothetical protein